MKAMVICGLVLAMTLATKNARAEETAADASTSAAKLPKTDSKITDIDEEITNARMRAATGAKAAWSFQSQFNYYGAALTNPLSTIRPQLNQGQASADPTNLQGVVSIKYRATDHDNLNLGVGVQYTPAFTSNAGKAQSASTNAYSPYLAYSRVFKSGAAQNVLTAQVTKYTLPADVDDSRLFGEVLLSHELMAEMGKSGLSLGIFSFISQEFYNGGATVDPSSTLYQFGVDPVAEYAFNDKLSLRTVSRWLTYTTQTGDPSRAALAQQTQSLGLGYTLNRDIWLYPNLQWMWTAMSLNQTTVGMSAYINL